MSLAITLNGDAAEVEEGTSVAALLERLGVAPEAVVVEHNRRVLRGPDLAGARVDAGDEIEVVHFVGGGC